jgi:hypothetical protein
MAMVTVRLAALRLHRLTDMLLDDRAGLAPWRMIAASFAVAVSKRPRIA